MNQSDAALTSRIAAHFEESARLKLAAAAALTEPVVRASHLFAQSLKAGGKALACGNGGSAADAQHFAAELGQSLRARAAAARRDRAHHRHIDADLDRQRLRLAAGILQAGEAIGRKGDVLLAISTSGNSANVLTRSPPRTKPACRSWR
jgi:D-sedoheptulose 7-phosphate isomerase